MKLGKFRQSKFGLTTALCVMTTVLLVNMAGGFAPLNTLFENACHRFGIPRAGAENVLMVYAAPSLLESGSQELDQLLDEIYRHAPKAIGIVAVGKPRDFQKLDRLPYARELTVGFRFDELLQGSGGRVSGHYQTGFTDLPLSRGPVFRNSIAAREQVGVELLSLEAKIVKAVSDLDFELPTGEFGITWCGGSGTIGRVNAADLIDGNSVRELIQGKVVLIGPDYGQMSDVYVPSTLGTSRMHRLEARANIIECLMQKKQTSHLSFTAGIFLLVLATLVTIQMARQIPLSYCLLGLGGAMGVILLAAILSIWLTYTWLPVSILTAAVLLAYGTITVQRFDTMENFVQYWKMRSTVREAHLESRFEEGVWKAIGDSAYQMFQPTRMTLLELKPGATHLKNVRSIGCDYSQIYEKRLDYRRSPYFDALEQNRPIVNPKGNYFIATPGLKEVEYILPMTNGLTTLGIIVLGMDKKKLDQWADFESFLARFTREMSQLIAGSRKAAEDDHEQQNWFQRLQKLPEEREFIEIQRNTEKQNDLIERAELAFDCSESALATFDIYGRVIRRNSSFNRMIQEAQLSISRASCIEVMAALSGKSQNACRKIFRRVILEDCGETVMIPNEVSSQSLKVMYVKPMHLVEEETRTSIEMHGLLIEIVDGAAFENLDRWNQRLTNALIPEANEKSQLLDSKRKEIRAIGEADQSPQKALQDLFGSVGNTVDEIVAVLQQCKELTQRRVTEDSGNCFTVDAVSIWKSVVKRIEETLAIRSIRIAESFDSQETMVCANPLLLDRVFATAVQFLLENALDDSEVRVDFSLGPERVACHFSNQGGGTPIETLRRSLQANDALGNSDESQKKSKSVVGQSLTPAQSDQLAEIEEWVVSWGGVVSVESHPHSMAVIIELLNGSTKSAMPTRVGTEVVDAGAKG